MRAALVVVVIAVVVVATFLVTRDEEVPIPRQQETTAPVPEPVVERVVVAEVAPQLPVPSVKVPEVDAGVPLTQVIFDVRRDGVFAVGTRLEVEKDNEVVSGTVNVMGGLTLPLEPGIWSVESPRTIQPRFMVTTSTRVVALQMITTKKISGRVVDRDKNPLRGVGVTSSESFMSATTNVDGTFEVFTTGTDVDVHARERQLVSAPVRVHAPATDVELVVEPTYPLTVYFSGVGFAGVQIAHRLGATYVPCFVSGCSAQVPTGAFTVLAVARTNGELLIARTNGAQSSDGAHIALKFSPVGPLVGVVTNADGTPLSDVPLLFSAAFKPRAFASTISKLDGSFSFSQSTRGDSASDGWVMPSWRITPMAPWTGETKYVSFGDAPITLVAEMPSSDAAR